MVLTSQWCGVGIAQTSKVRRKADLASRYWQGLDVVLCPRVRQNQGFARSGQSELSGLCSLGWCLLRPYLEFDVMAPDDRAMSDICSVLSRAAALHVRRDSMCIWALKIGAFDYKNAVCRSFVVGLSWLECKTPRADIAALGHLKARGKLG